MAENFVIKTKNGEDWDILHPETNIGQVIDLQDRLETLEELPAALTAVGSRVDALETDVTTIKEDIEGLVATDVTAHNVSETAHADIRETLEDKADLVDGKVPAVQLVDVIAPHNTSETAHSDIRGALTGHNTSETAHGDIRMTISSKAEKSVTADVMIAVAPWSSGTYTYSNSAITSTSIIELIPSPSITVEQLTAFQKANVVGISQASGSVTMKAFGAAPIVNVPVRFVVRGDL